MESYRAIHAWVDLWFQPYCSSQNQGVLQRQGPDIGVSGLDTIRRKTEPQKHVSHVITRSKKGFSKVYGTASILSFKRHV